MGNYAASETTLRTAIDVRQHWPIGTDDDRSDQFETATYLALAVNA